MNQKLLFSFLLWLTLLGSTWAQDYNALHFDGTDDYVDLPDFTTTHDFSQGFSFTAWVKWDAFTGNARVFEIGNGSGNVNNSIILRTDASTGTLIFQCSSGLTNSEIKTDAAVVTTNTWHHVAATISSVGAATIYIDGAAVKSGSVSAPKNVARANNWLGKSAWTEDKYFNGTMDEVSIWQKALTQTEIEAIKQTSPIGNEDKLVAYYNFNQATGTTLTDATTNAKHGTLTSFALNGTTSNWVEGYTASIPSFTNNSLHFDGTNDYVACPAINPTTFTVEAWVYSTLLNRDQPAISTLSEVSTEGMELHIADDNKPLITIRNAGGWLDVKAPSAVSLNTWVHLAATYNGSTVKLYVNGAEVQSVSATSYTPGSKQLYLGKRTDGNASNFAGSIDEVRIWSTALTQTEISAAKDNPLTGSESNLLAYYNFNQGTAGGSNIGVTTLPDATSNAKHGTLINFALSGKISNWVEGFTVETTPTYYLSATPSELSLAGVAGSSGTIFIQSNTQWTLSGGADWLMTTPVSGSGNGIVTFTSSTNNEGVIARTANLTFSGKDIVNPITITVTQDHLVQGIRINCFFIMEPEMEMQGISLENAFASLEPFMTEKLEVTGGYFTLADWDWLKNQSGRFGSLTHFSIADGVSAVDDVADQTSAPTELFPFTLKELHLAKVRKIGKGACNNLHNITSVSLPNAMILDEQAFSGCVNLESISLPQITSIGADAFNCCTVLSDLLLGKNPPTVGFNAFRDVCSPRYLAYADANGNLLTGTALENARAAYKAASDGNTTDNLWFGWIIDRELYKVTVVEPANGTLTAGNADAVVFGYYPTGATINVTATPNYGYKLKPESLYGFVTDNPSLIEGIADNKFVMPDKNITVTATFEPKLSASANTVTLGKEAEQSQSVTITCDGNYEITNIEESPDWLQVGFLTMGETKELIFTTKKANPWAVEREVVFTLVAAEANDITITVKQAAADPVTTFSAGFVELAWQQGSSAIVEMQSNEQWAVTEIFPADMWSVEPASGLGNASLIITALADNNGSENLTGRVKINNHVINLNQKFNARHLEISEQAIRLGAAKGSRVDVQVTSDTRWEFKNLADWFTVSPMVGEGNAIVTFTANQDLTGLCNNLQIPVGLEGDRAHPVYLTVEQVAEQMPLGKGTEAEPFLVSSLDNLMWMSVNMEDGSPYLESHYVLINDIDASETHHWINGFESIPHFYSRNRFAGTFNGKGFAIHNLFTRSGLFSMIDREARIENLALVNCTVEGVDVGGLVTFNDGVISACYVSGYMSGNALGLLVCDNSGLVSDCYTSGRIDGSGSAGLCYMNNETITGSYVAVALSEGNHGFIYHPVGIARGYFNSDLFPFSPDAAGLTTEQMKHVSSYNEERLDFENTWGLTEGVSFPCLKGVYNYPLVLPTYATTGAIDAVYTANLEVVQMDYPVSSIELAKAPEGMILSGGVINWTPLSGGLHQVVLVLTDSNGKSVNHSFSIAVPLAGDGTNANPYQITTIAELDYVRNNTAAQYQLMNDLDFDDSEFSKAHGGHGWEPIDGFTGIIWGQGHVIKNLFVDQHEGVAVGLFGSIKDALIVNLGLAGIDVSGNYDVGGLCGRSVDSQIEYCYTTGTVTGTGQNTGGLVGYSQNTLIANCYNMAVVAGRSNVAGIAGTFNTNRILDSYNCGFVSGGGVMGALVGIAAGQPEIKGYFGSETSGLVHGVGIDGGVSYDVKGLSTQQMKQRESFEGWDFSMSWVMQAGKTYPALFPSKNNAPFAFNDNFEVSKRLNLDKILANDNDYETGQAKLVFRVLKVDGSASIDESKSYLLFDPLALAGDVVTLHYQVGELIAPGDTLWGAYAKVDIVKAPNSAPVLSAVASKTINKGESLTVTMDDVTAHDIDEGDVLDLVIADGENYTVSGTTITPAAGFIGTLSVGILVTDGELISNAMDMSVVVAMSTGVGKDESNLVKLCPNPCRDLVMVVSPGQISRVTFVNLAGQVVLVEDAPTSRIHVASLRPGIYLVKVEDGNGKTTVLRLEKQ